ncbi:MULTISPECIES: EF-hand domain-containing protein [unclassified Pseudomonas]|uniref:EF-hand domain-containing protein n=1 Tax=unclassified Pseudomonas TaxID=196821 RepID=UPI000BC4D4F7|nr:MULTISPECIES: EF-hand domain-containing protein [unclassified Pseudomonas]PVZ16370.1 calmodulin [Pseudomonas sp. URIL14HWK12:I12]PVZ25774.1 calmodulin [Pseudomonas sp. URIL14HWK12:I10]PVZ36702.1 calmodulin [Pseudomonas sp. URIL14HWK12:I11]SNZ12787.1 EF-hand domain pair [Pseudomonas sp. URIL14HWK12:I9]
MLELTGEQLQLAKNAFHALDKDRDGTLTVGELSDALKRFLSDETVDQIIGKINTDGDGKISWNEFLQDYKNQLEND